MMLRYDPKKLQEKLHGPYPIVKIQTNGTVSLQRRPGISERIIQYKKTMTLQRPLTKRQDNKLLTVDNRRDNTDTLLKNKDYYYQTQQDQSKILKQGNCPALQSNHCGGQCNRIIVAVDARTFSKHTCQACSLVCALARLNGLLQQ